MKKYTRIIGKSGKNLRDYRSKAKPQQDFGQNKWNPVVGLEIHAQINSVSKLFSGAGTNFAMPINSCVSYFDCATPGTLPVLNRRCVEAGVLTALALSCRLYPLSLFDRKHYFYADSPAGYQITQQRRPLAVNGEIMFHVCQVAGVTADSNEKLYTKTSRIKQIQLEQDSGKTLHSEFVEKSLLDLNRAGIPLMELVFEPDLSNGEEAAALVKELILILQRLKTCSCKMEEGALRVDANVSVSRGDQRTNDKALGVRTEVKNIGSVRAVAGAVEYEIERQIEILESGGSVVNETRSWDAQTRKTIPMRDKQDKLDYRFMPEPNLPPLHLHMHSSYAPSKLNRHNLVDVDYLRSTIPEMPQETRKKLAENFHLETPAILTIVNEHILLRMFNDVMRENGKRSSKLVANILIMELMTLVNNDQVQIDSCVITAKHIGKLVDLLESKEINRTVAKKILIELTKHPDKLPREIIVEKNWALISDESTLLEMCRTAVDNNPKAARQYKAGKTKAINALLGDVATSSDQRANMSKVAEIMKKLLNKTK